MIYGYIRVSSDKELNIRTFESWRITPKNSSK